MTDEKLKHLEEFIRLVKLIDTPCENSYERTLDAIEFIETHFESKYKPSGKPCYDKPAGVPIIHGETL